MMLRAEELVAIGLLLLFAAALPEGAAAVSDRDIEILNEFFSAVHFPTAIRANQTNVCTEWPNNVICGPREAYIAVLNFSSLGLYGTLPVSLGQLTTGLQSFAVDGNELSSQVPNECSQWGSTLQEASFYSNHFSGTLPPSFRNWTSVVNFRFQGNSLTGTLPQQYSEWKNVQVFLVSNNFLSGTLPPEYALWQYSIQRIEMTNNSLSGPLPERWSNFSTLYVLRMYNNALNGTLPAVYSKIPNLIFFEMSNNSLTGTLPPEYSAWGSHMNSFLVNNNSLSGTLPKDYSTWVEHFLVLCVHQQLYRKSTS